MIGLAVGVLALGCGDSEPVGVKSLEPNQALAGCRVTSDNLFDGGPGRDGIPSLINPPLVPLDDPEAAYVDQYVQTREEFEAEARVVALLVGDRAFAIPYNVLWWHEIVNVDVVGRRVAITYCPLTGSPMAFDVSDAGTERLGVSGLIFQNNLVMFDPETESLWPQLCGRAVEGPRTGKELVPVPIIDMAWEAWKARHPNSLVPSENTGFDRNYDRYPYGGYENNTFLLFPQEQIDDRRPMKERVLGIPDGDGGEAFPFGEFDGAGTLAVSTQRGSDDIVILWDGDARAAAAFFPRTSDGQSVTVRSAGTGFVDAETGSNWNVEGRAVAGPLAGARLEPFPDATVAYWFAWAAFHPETLIWERE